MRPRGKGVGHELYGELEKRGWKVDFLKVIKNWWENYHPTLNFYDKKSTKGVATTKESVKMGVKVTFKGVLHHGILS